MEISYPDDHARASYAAETQALGDQISEFAGHLNAAIHRFLMLIAEFDRRAGWNDGSTQSCAHWLTGNQSPIASAGRRGVQEGDR